ncbi:MAG TPA: hypothetical protein VF676_08385 [Flavobacterium sp.]|jgi:hypothetical protein
MNQFTFEVLFHLIGIGSASGLFYKDNSVYLISDNGSNLYEYKIAARELSRSPLFESDITENIPKKTKPDFEAIAEHNDTLYVFGSGSTANRNRMVIVDRTTKSVTNVLDLTDLYTVMQSFGEITADDFNIEGVVCDGQTWYFFQRGNGGTGKNGIFSVKGDIAAGDFTILFNGYKLPKISGVETSFTDATLVGNKIYFLATAENTKSTYDDGDILGSIIGRLDLKKMKIEKTKQITDKHKLEGITLFENADKHISFLLCEDNDTDGLQSDVFKLTLGK